MSTNTAERTIAVIAKFRDIPAENLTLDTSLSELNMDSLDGLSLIFELEEEFDILIPDDKALKLKTIAEMVDGIDRLLSQETMVDESDDKSLKSEAVVVEAGLPERS